MMNFAESGYLMASDECLREAERQFAIAEAVGRRHYMEPLWARGGWFMLLRWAELTATTDVPPDAAVELCPKCGNEEWDHVTAERGRETDVPFNHCPGCDYEWPVSERNLT